VLALGAACGTGRRTGVLGLRLSADTGARSLILSVFPAEHLVELPEVPDVAEDDFHVDYIREIGACRIENAEKV
jgi:hypothetical protein